MQFAGKDEIKYQHNKDLKLCEGTLTFGAFRQADHINGLLVGVAKSRPCVLRATFRPLGSLCMEGMAFPMEMNGEVLEATTNTLCALGARWGSFSTCDGSRWVGLPGKKGEVIQACRRTLQGCIVVHMLDQTQRDGGRLVFLPCVWLASHRKRRGLVEAFL